MLRRKYCHYFNSTAFRYLLSKHVCIYLLIFCYTVLGPESSAQLKEERIENDMDEKSSSPEATSTSSLGEKANAEPDDGLLQAMSAIKNAYSRKPKPSRQSSGDCNAVPTGKLQPQPTTGSLRRKRKPKVS